MSGKTQHEEQQASGQTRIHMYVRTVHTSTEMKIVKVRLGGVKITANKQASKHAHVSACVCMNVLRNALAEARYS